MSVPGQEMDNLRNSVASLNFVYAVEYALEKVHSGVLATVLNTPAYGSELAARLWNQGHPNDPPFSAANVSNVRAQKERPIGSAGRIDLLISFHNAVAGQDCSILCEYKVDGTGDHVKHQKQCEAYKGEWGKHNSEQSFCFLFVTTGGAWSWDSPNNVAWLDVPCIKDLLRPAQNEQLVKDYLSALDDELIRRRIAPDVLGQCKVEDRQLLGYRGYDLWYAFYDHLRGKLNQPKDWKIYSGGHNPVMNWDPSWNDPRYKCAFGVVFCEFNYADFVIKLAWNSGSKDASNLYEVLDSVWGQFGHCEFERVRHDWNPRSYTSLAKMSCTHPDIDRIAESANGFLPAGLDHLCRLLPSST